MKLFHIISLSLIVACVSSLPLSTDTIPMSSLRGLSQELPSESRVDLPTRSDLSDNPVDLADGHPTPKPGAVLRSETTSLITLPTVYPVSPSPNTPSPLIYHLAIVACIFFAIFLGVIAGLSCMFCRYGKSAKQADEEHNMSKSIRLLSQTSVDELKPVVVEEEQLPRAPSSKRFKRYASGKVPLSSVGPLSIGPPGRHSKQSSRKPSPLRHVYSSASFVNTTSEVPASPCTSLNPESIAYAHSDGSSFSADMPPTPDLEDVAIRKEPFDMNDPFAYLPPSVPLGSPLKAPASSVEQDISDACDSCWIAGDYVVTDDEDDDDAGREPVHALWYVVPLGIQNGMCDVDVIETDYPPISITFPLGILVSHSMESNVQKQIKTQLR
ncbi:hypothetical protein JB92DRAFT_3092351 [Gautieria morchelliformis]|nr:hypothetical protein JB92DRAFT_3092351 [Gautieria morchelliformis]